MIGLSIKKKGIAAAMPFYSSIIQVRTVSGFYLPRKGRWPQLGTGNG